MNKLAARTFGIRCYNDVQLLKNGLEQRGICSVSANSDNTIISITLKVPSYIVPQQKNGQPVLANEHQLVVHLPRSYPYDKPVVQFVNTTKRFAHPNVFSFGHFCIGEWENKPEKNTDSLLGVVQRCIEAGSFCKEQVNLSSPAATEWIQFYKKKKSEGAFPLYKPWWKESKKRIVFY